MSIQISPINPSIAEWQTVIFNLVAIDTGSYSNFTSSLSWSFNNTPVQKTLTSGSSTITSTYTVQAVGANGGAYTLQWTGSISSSLGTTIIGYSSSVVSNLSFYPLVLSSPNSMMGMEGSKPGALIATFSSSLPMTFVWLWNGVVPTNGTQTDTSTGSVWDINSGLYIPQCQGTYQCQATTDSGSVTSNGASVSFMPLGACIDNPVWNPFAGGYFPSR